MPPGCCLKSKWLLLSVVVLAKHPSDGNGNVTSEGGSSERNTAQQWEVNQNAYCENYKEIQIDGFRDYGVSRNGCQLKCEDQPHCVGIQMDCLHDCHLITSCTKTVLSNCDTYLAMKPNLPRAQSLAGEEMIKPPRRGELLIHGVVVILFSTLVFHVFLHRFEYKNHDDINAPVPSRTDAYSSIPRVHRGEIAISDLTADQIGFAEEAFLQHGEPVLERQDSWHERPMFANQYLYQRIGLIVLALLFLRLVWYDAMATTQFPKDQEASTRGVCGLVHGDLAPMSWRDLLTSRMSWSNVAHGFLINGSFYAPPALHALPLPCVQVYSTDFVCEYDGPLCGAWCDTVMGPSAHWSCTFLVPELAQMYKVCAKVTTWQHWVQQVPANWRKYVIYGLPVMYCVLSWMMGALRHSMLKGKAHEQSAIIPPREDEAECEFFTNKRLRHPYAFVRVRSDADGAWKELVSYVPAFLLDLWGDLNAGLTFFFKGEILYGSIILAVPLISNLHDPLQADNVCALLMSLDRGFAVYELPLVHRRKGAYEGVYSLFVVVFALMRGIFYQSFVKERYVYFSLIFNLFVSVFLTIPQASRASYVIMQKALRHHTYYDEVENHKKEMYVTLEWLPTLEALAIAVAVGRSFNNLWLLVWLWMIGFVIGFCGCCLWRHSTNHFNVRAMMSLFCAFVCWPLSPTRLMGTYRILRDMEEGKVSLEVCQKGSASFQPRVHYCHRLLTLVTFWVYVGFLRDDADIFNWMWSRVRHLKPNVMVELIEGRPVCMAVTFIIGWLSIGLQAVIMCYYGERFDTDYENMAFGKPCKGRANTVWDEDAGDDTGQRGSPTEGLDHARASCDALATVYTETTIGHPTEPAQSDPGRHRLARFLPTCWVYLERIRTQVNGSTAGAQRLRRS